MRFFLTFTGSFSLRETSLGLAALYFLRPVLVAGGEAQPQQLINNFSNLVVEWTRTQRRPDPTVERERERGLFRVDSFSFFFYIPSLHDINTFNHLS